MNKNIKIDFTITKAEVSLILFSVGVIFGIITLLSIFGDNLSTIAIGSMFTFLGVFFGFFFYPLD